MGDGDGYADFRGCDLVDLYYRVQANTLQVIRSWLDWRTNNQGKYIQMTHRKKNLRVHYSLR